MWNREISGCWRHCSNTNSYPNTNADSNANADSNTYRNPPTDLHEFACQSEVYQKGQRPIIPARAGATTEKAAKRAL